MKKPAYYEVYTGDKKNDITNYYDNAKTPQEALRKAKRVIEEGEALFAEVVEAKVLYTVHATGAKVIEHK